ncbi:hypothetical protein ACWEPM_00510 [Streptomyces sp. NPDC004244]
MSDHSPVDPAEVPVFTGDLAALGKKAKAISSGGATVQTKASDVHTSFGGLQAFYQAPEAEQLFATTKPVSDWGVRVSSDMTTIAGALDTYARDAEPLVRRLDSLRIEAESFRSKVSGDEKWCEDGDLTDQNLERRNKIAEVWAQFHEVERSAHAKIVALVDGSPLKVNDGSNGPGMYGYKAEDLKQAKSLPWGDAVEESVPAWQVWEHAWDFGTGFIVDGVGGTLEGLGGLVGLDGGDTFKASWTGLAKLSTASAITSLPAIGPIFLAAPADKLPPWLRESRTAMKETGKALLAWDQWGSNPSRAAGAVVFNVITTIATGGTGGSVSGAGKAGAVAKALSFAGKAGRVVDPMTYVFKGAGAGVSKVGDVMAALRGMGKGEIPKINIDGAVALPEGAKALPDGSIKLPPGSALPEGAIKLPNDTIKLPQGTTEFPPGTVKLPKDGAAQFMDPEGNIYDAKGNVLQLAEEAPAGKPGAKAGTPKVDAPKADTPATAKTPDRVLAGVGGRADDAIRLGSDTSDPARTLGNQTPGPGPGISPVGHAPDNMPRNSTDMHAQPSPAPRPDAPSAGGQANPASGAGRAESPFTSERHPEGPGGTGRPDGPVGQGSLDGTTDSGDDATRTHGDTTTGAVGESGRLRTIPEPPSFMRQDGNPYGSPGSLTRQQIMEIQAYRANYEEGYFKEYYAPRGYRHFSTVPDESGYPPPQLIKDPANPSSWIPKGSAPPPFPTKYHDASWDRRGTAAQLGDPQIGATLDEAASVRHNTLTADNIWHRPLADAKEAWKQNGTAENRAAYLALKAEHAPFHDAMTKASEAYGEAVARHHAIPQFYEDAILRPTAGPKNGNDQFDQVWERKKDDGFVVVEAKGDADTPINERTLPSGLKAKQGSREYFLDIMNEIWKRAQAGDAAELRLYNDLKNALIADKVEYILVKGVSDGPNHSGFKSRRFDIGNFKDEDFFFENIDRSSP